VARGLFARLRADKFLSDIIESVLGAIFIDCGGDLDVCYSYASRLDPLPLKDQGTCSLHHVLRNVARMNNINLCFCRRG
jgi:hypothetical protein